MRGNAISGEIPINQRIINRKLHPLPAASIRQFFHHVPLERGCIHDIILRVFGMIHTKTVMMFRREHDGFHPRRLCQSHHGIGIPFLRIKFFRHRLVLRLRDLGKRLYLLTIPGTNRLSLPNSPQLRIQSPVNKHGKLLIHPIRIGFLLSKSELHA